MVTILILALGALAFAIVLAAILRRKSSGDIRISSVNFESYKSDEVHKHRGSRA
jgi:hypothetical protein